MGDTRKMNLLGVEVPAGNDPASVYRRIQIFGFSDGIDQPIFKRGTGVDECAGQQHVHRLLAAQVAGQRHGRR